MGFQQSRDGDGALFSFCDDVEDRTWMAATVSIAVLHEARNIYLYP
jgi:hypothetical protein